MTVVVFSDMSDVRRGVARTADEELGKGQGNGSYIVYGCSCNLLVMVMYFVERPLSQICDLGMTAIGDRVLYGVGITFPIIHKA